jgi:hypothetical protein
MWLRRLKMKLLEEKQMTRIEKCMAQHLLQSTDFKNKTPRFGTHNLRLEVETDIRIQAEVERGVGLEETPPGKT